MYIITGKRVDTIRRKVTIEGRKMCAVKKGCILIDYYIKIPDIIQELLKWNLLSDLTICPK